MAEQPFTLPNTVMTYTYANRLATVNGQPAAYDADGNMTAGPLAGAISSLTYDARNRLTAAGNTGYIYDAENNRIGVTETVYGKTEQTSYVINPHAPLSQVLIKTDARGKQTFYVYGLGLIGQEEAGGAYSTYHFDRRGSTIALTDENGSVTDRFQYAPYGELVNRSGTTSTPFLYNGRYGVITDANGLYYMRARYYNPEIKRFINQDVLLGSIDNGQSLNRYAYVNGNPVSYVDPFGLSRDGDSDNPSILQLIGQVWGNRINYAKNWLYGELEQRGFPYPDAALDAWDYSFGYFGGEVLGGAIGIGGKAFGPKGAGKSLTNGARMTTNKALDAANDFLGAGYKEVAPGVFRSKDGLRQVRMTDADITGAHGGGAHMNFETGKSITNPNGRVTFKVNDNMHIFLTD